MGHPFLAPDIVRAIVEGLTAPLERAAEFVAESQLIKGKTSNRLMRDHAEGVLRARGYFVVTTGNVTDEVIAKYIELQGAVPQDDDSFKVSE